MQNTLSHSKRGSRRHLLSPTRPWILSPKATGFCRQTKASTFVMHLRFAVVVLWRKHNWETEFYTVVVLIALRSLLPDFQPRRQWWIKILLPWARHFIHHWCLEGVKVSVATFPPAVVVFRHSALLAAPHLKNFAAIPSVSLMLFGYTNRNVSLSREWQCKIALL